LKKQCIQIIELYQTLLVNIDPKKIMDNFFFFRINYSLGRKYTYDNVLIIPPPYTNNIANNKIYYNQSYLTIF